jgi:hypothetical protein
MIIKFAKDAKSGACDYMDEGTDGDRDVKDERIQLTDLSCHETIYATNALLKKLKKFDKYKDNYKHIVFSLQEDNLTKEQMQKIIDDFLALYMHPYEKNEYVYYAEAHKPKIKTNKNGEKRHLHIHLFIHKYSPTLNRRLKFDSHPRRRQELNLIKNYLIKKHNLQYTFTNKIISKTKIDIYSKNFKNRKELKENVEQYILSNLQNYNNFNDMINDIKKTFEIENIKFSKNAKTPYVSIKFKNFKNNIRFKGLLFDKKTFEEARDAYLKNVDLKKYDDVYKLSLSEMLQQMQKRQEYLKKEIDKRFKFARERKKNLRQNKEYLLFKEIQKAIREGKKVEDIDIKQINRVLFKLKLLNTYLNLNLVFLQNIQNMGIFQTCEGVKFIKKGGDVNTEIKIENDSFMITSRGRDEQEEARIAVAIVVEKIRAGELKKEDLVLDATKKYKRVFEEELNKQLQKEEPQDKTKCKNREFANSNILF